MAGGAAGARGGRHRRQQRRSRSPPPQLTHSASKGGGFHPTFHPERLGRHNSRDLLDDSSNNHSDHHDHHHHHHHSKPHRTHSKESHGNSHTRKDQMSRSKNNHANSESKQKAARMVRIEAPIGSQKDLASSQKSLGMNNSSAGNHLMDASSSKNHHHSKVKKKTKKKKKSSSPSPSPPSLMARQSTGYSMASSVNYATTTTTSTQQQPMTSAPNYTHHHQPPPPMTAMMSAGGGKRNSVNSTTSRTKSAVPVVSHPGNIGMQQQPKQQWQPPPTNINHNPREYQFQPRPGPPPQQWNVGVSHLSIGVDDEQSEEETLIDHTRERFHDEDSSTEFDNHGLHPALMGPHVSELASLHEESDVSSHKPEIMKQRTRWCCKVEIPMWWLASILLVGWFIAMYYVAKVTESPQAEAYQWYRGHPQYEELNVPSQIERKKQIFALATMCYALEYNKWTTEEQGYWLSYNVHECYWWNQTYNVSMCNNDTMKVAWVQIRDNRNIVNGSFPAELALLSDLAILQFTNISGYQNNLTHLLPFPNLEEEEESPLTMLQGLFVTDNAHLDGVLPNFTELSPNMTHLDLHKNAHTGNLYDTIDLGLLSHLQYLDLSDNAFTGTIPWELGLLTQLTHLDLHGNGLEGTLPRELQALTNLVYMDLSGNDLVGTLLSDIGRFTNLKSLSVNNNRFRGKLPTELGQLTQLTNLATFRNYMTGPVPEEVCPMDGLEIEIQCQFGHRCPCQFELDCQSNCTSICSCHEAAARRLDGLHDASPVEWEEEE